MNPIGKITAAADRPAALYRVGEKVVFTVSLEGAADREIGVHFSLLENSLKPCAAGERTFAPGKSQFTVTHEWHKPSFVLLKISLPEADAELVLAGAGCEPEKLRPAEPRPDDFDAFWNAKKVLVDALPFDEPRVPVSSFTDDLIETYAISLNSINGSKARGFFARPKGPGPFPATMILHGAGISSISPGEAVAFARRGAMAIDVNQNDIENGQPEAYYRELEQNALKDWTRRGRDDRETSYFLRMFCSSYRAAQYLATRPEWDGEHLVLSGSSLGGALSFATAYLCPKVTSLTANVPALSDLAGPLIGRAAGTPTWVEYLNGKPNEKQLAASRYFDTVNFARTVRAQALVSVGFIDGHCPPSSVYAAFNVLSGEKRMFNMPGTGHAIPDDWIKERDAFVTAELGLK